MRPREALFGWLPLATSLGLCSVGCQGDTSAARDHDADETTADDAAAALGDGAVGTDAGTEEAM